MGCGSTTLLLSVAIAAVSISVGEGGGEGSVIKHSFMSHYLLNGIFILNLIISIKYISVIMICVFVFGWLF